MKILVQVSENICDSFAPTKNERTHAALIGTESENRLCVHRLVFCETHDYLQWYREIECSLPGGFKTVGFWSSLPSDEAFKKFFSTESKNANFVLWNCTPSDVASKSLNVDQFSFYSNYEENVEIETTFVGEDELIRNTITLRCEYPTFVELHMPEICDQQEIESEVLDAFSRLESRLRSKSATDESEQSFYCFKAESVNALITEFDESTNLPEGLTSTSTCFDLWRQLQVDERASKRKNLQFTRDSLSFHLLKQSAGLEVAKQQFNFVPVIYYEVQSFTSVVIPLKLRVFVQCSQTTQIRDVFELLMLSLLRQVDLAKECCLKFCDFQNKTFVGTECFPFLPPNFTHFLLLHYPKNVCDKELESYRRSYSTRWDLPLKCPTVRRGNAFSFADQIVGPQLRNVHEFVSSSGIHGTIGLVKGIYQYHHYMQDNFNDNGWGCAYRSFQTIWSWFLLQGYTDKAVPTHREIQQTLVNIGDRPATFLGTKQWIGSMELSYCLQEMLNVESRIVTVSSGSEMLSKSRELIRHFETEGTPIMIGGGVLAHTILGVHISEDFRQAKFLVLDPHYTGDDVVKTVIDKGWCGWKPVTFWAEDAFYNMLLPTRPAAI